jgi:BASS family bile acid:Na+ symporter
MDTPGLIKPLNVAALVAIMLSIGMTVTFEQVAESAKHHLLVVFGVLANFVLVPLVTVSLLAAFQPDPLVSAGFLILAVCPGAPLGPAFAHIARGDVSMATGSMVILAGLSVVLSPILLIVLLGWVASERNLSVSYLAILFTLLVTQLLPLALGLVIHRVAPQLTQKLVKPIRAIANVLLLSLIAAIILAQYETLADIRIRAWLGMVALFASSLGIGWFCGGLNVEKQKSMALTTSTRNVAVGLVIAGGSLAETPAVTAVVAYGLFCTLGGLACAFLFIKVANSRVSTAVL